MLQGEGGIKKKKKTRELRFKDIQHAVGWTLSGKSGFSSWPAEATKRILVVIVTTCTLLIIRLQIMGSKLPVFTRFDNPASVSEWPTRYLTYNYLVSVNLWLLLFPCDLCCDWTMGTIPLVESVTDKRNLATLASYVVVLVLVYVALVSENRQQTNNIIMSLGLLVFPFLPASNLFFPVGFVVAERVLYMPSMGFCMLVAYGFGLLMEKRLSVFPPFSSHLRSLVGSISAANKSFIISNLVLGDEHPASPSDKTSKTRRRNLRPACSSFLSHDSCIRANKGEDENRKFCWTAMLLLILVHTMKTYMRNFDWKDEYSVFMSGLKVNQRNAKLFNNVGHALENQERFQEALKYFQKAVSVQQDDIGAHINLGRTYNHLKMFKEAEEAYLEAKALLPKAKPGESYQARIAPNHLNVFLNLANLIAKNETRLEEADFLYRQAISMRADYTQAYINRGDVLLKLNRTKEAQQVYEKALFFDSTNPDIYYNLGVVFLEQGKTSQALAYLDKALEYDPDHEQALLNSAILLQEFGQEEFRKIAQERLLKLLQKDDRNEKVYFNLGMLAMDDNDLKAAEHWFRKAIYLKDDFRSALFNLALLLADDNRPLEAAPFLNQLVRYHPNHVKGLILLGDIYINTIKDLDAAENCYKKILELEPENVQGLHNLCVVYVERGNLIEAENCLKRVHILAPDEDYIIRHLQIVQTRIGKSKVQTNSSNSNNITGKNDSLESSNNNDGGDGNNNSSSANNNNNSTLRKRIRNDTENRTEKDVVIPKNIDKKVNPSSLS
ncbi:hypothetical protein V9T40_006573 [Parthenolecanium corni]|uniref:dolichyl-phosphate-mannose--protein mannosyltransferase n=1 Tax=Parthenolecanium corni TaxID=536013 RepID=A0AAN9Y7J3_9HEMI